ncbi:transcription antitermination factor NusB [Propioniciclava flava]
MTEPALPPHGRIANRDNSPRTKARKRALDILFESELRERPTVETLADRVALAEPPVRPFTIDLVNGYLEFAEVIDSVLGDSLADGWTLDRMNRVDRNLARIAIYEMMHTDTPQRVAIAEAVDLAAELFDRRLPGVRQCCLGACHRRAATTHARLRSR